MISKASCIFGINVLVVRVSRLWCLFLCLELWYLERGACLEPLPLRSWYIGRSVICCQPCPLLMHIRVLSWWICHLKIYNIINITIAFVLNKINSSHIVIIAQQRRLLFQTFKGRFLFRLQLLPWRSFIDDANTSSPGWLLLSQCALLMHMSSFIDSTTIVYHLQLRITMLPSMSSINAIYS